MSPPHPARQPFRHLRITDRHQIQALVTAGLSNPKIAAILGVDPTTVRRERHRLRGTYDAKKANTRAKRARRASDGRPQLLNTGSGRKFMTAMVAVMGDGRSVSQALTILAAQADALPFTVTATMVYRWIRRRWKTDMLARRANNAMIRPTSSWYRRKQATKRTTIPNLVPLSDRPDEQNGRDRLGVWEGDLIKGVGSRTTLVTLVCRASRLVRILWVPSGQAADVDTALRDWVSAGRDEVVSITWDRGIEMCRHVAFTADTGVAVFFADAHSPWQRGTNENTNGVLRRWWPKGTDLPADPDEIARVETLANSRPMPTLSWSTPEQTYQVLAAA